MNSSIKAIEERADKATEGPWRWGDWDAEYGTTEDPTNKRYLEHNSAGKDADLMVRSRGDNCVGILETTHGFPASHLAGAWEKKLADAQFIAHARQDIPTLLARIREQDAEILRLTEENKEHFLNQLNAAQKLIPVAREDE